MLHSDPSKSIRAESPKNAIPKIVDAYSLGSDGENTERVPEIKDEISKTQSKPFFPHRS